MATGPRPGNKSSKSLVPASVPAGQVKVPDAPAHFTPAMVELWQLIWKGGGGFYQPSDAMSISRYVELSDRRRQLLDMAEAEGMVVMGSKAQPVAHPALKLAAETEVLMGRLECLLGLNPSDRVRLGIAALEQQSALDAFFDRKKQVIDAATTVEGDDA